MKAYETTATVDKTGALHVQGVPFAPGTDVQVTITENRATSSNGLGAETAAVAAARERMRELFGRIQGFRSATLIRREELYDRDGLH
jgi:hypothetical protein